MIDFAEACADSSNLSWPGAAIVIVGLLVMGFIVWTFLR